MIRKVLLAAALIAVLASLASAQRGGGGGGGRGGDSGGSGRGFPGMQAVDKSETIAKELKLTPAQQTQFESIMDDAQKQTTPLLQQVADAKKALLDVNVAGKDTAELVKKLAGLNAQVLGIEVDAYSKAAAKLDDKQKSKAPKLFEMMAGIFTTANWRRTN